jgi:hypothetical protein
VTSRLVRCQDHLGQNLPDHQVVQYNLAVPGTNCDMYSILFIFLKEPESGKFCVRFTVAYCVT